MKEKITIIIVCFVLTVSVAVALNPFFPLIVPPVMVGTITDAACRVEHSCNGSATEFAFTFPIINTSDMKVYHRNDSTGAETLLTEAKNYSVSATNNDYTNGGTVTTVSTYAKGITLVLLRDIPDSQQTDLEDSGVLRVEALEDALDKLTMLHEQLQEEVDRCLKYPPSDSSGISSVLPNSVDRANTTLIFDANSEPDVQ